MELAAVAAHKSEHQEAEQVQAVLAAKKELMAAMEKAFALLCGKEGI